MSMEDNSTTTSRRSGLRATKRIDYSSLEGGALDDHEQVITTKKKDVVSLENNNNNNKAKKGGEKQPTKKGTRSSSLSGTEFSSQLGSPSSSSSLPIDDDGEWDDRPKQSKRRTTRTKSLSDADWDTSGTPTRVSSRSRSTPNYDESEAMDVDIDEQTDSDAEREGEEGNRSQDQDQDQDPDQDQEDMEGYDQDNEYEDEGEVVKTKKAPRRASTETYDYYDEPKTIEKILSRREVNKDKPAGSEPDYEYLVKWKSLSYLHCSYVSAEYISSERMGKSRLQKFVQKITSTDEDIEPYNADYLEVDRIIAQRRLPPDNTLQYLVKWKSLGYNEVSWEDQEDIRDDAKVEQFIQANKVPSAVPVRIPNVIPGAPSTRPPPESWVPLKESPVYKGENTLRPYQLEGLNWLVFCWYQRRNSILADEMGLGKTVQAVSTVNHLRTVHNLRGPFLVVAPLSTIPHWKREFEGWTTMNTIVYHGNSESRNMIRQHEFFHRDSKDKIIPKFFKFNVLITTFEMIMQDRSVLQPIEWTALVVDEAHRLKNKNCRLITELRTFKFSHLLLLTGTPLQNNTQELWTLLNFLAPTHFSSLDEFLADFGELKEVEQVEKLHGVLRPYLLRRMKENVERSIAPKEETIVEVELTTLQKKYYRAIYERNFTFLKKGGKSSNVPSLLNVMMELRKCCNHPYLIKGVEQNETEHLAEREQVYLKLIEASGKMVLIDKLLPKLKAGGHKVLIFSQMVRVLDILEDYLVWKGYIHERLDGRIRGNDRQAAIDRFSKPDSDRFVFLLCTRAGGLGINLTAADTVIIFDSDWNPQNDVQAQARCHRIGQEKSVKVYRLITRNTYEKHMFERASKKLGLDQAVLTKMNASTTMPASDDAVPAPAADPILDKKTIDSLLKYGAYDLFREDDTAASRFYEEDIDRILERSTVVRSNTESAPKDNALSSFSKASFVSNSAAPELDINDPDFWLKLLPQAADAPNPNIQVQPRVRRQVHRFTGAEDDSDLEEEEVIQSSDDEGTYGQKEKGWTMGERARFKLGLMTLGYGRWHEIKSMARITRWSASEIGMYGKAFVAKVLMFAEVDDPKIMDLIQNVAPTSATNEVNEDEVPKQIDSEEQQTISDTGSVDGASVGATSPSQTATTTTTTTTTTANSEENAAAKDEESSTNFERDPSLCDAKFQEYLQKNAKQVVRRLETLANLRLLVQSNFTALDDIEVPDSPAPWWGAEEDRSLLLGTHKHGFGRYEEIRADPALCFLGRVEMRGIKEGGKDESSEKVKVKSESDVVKDESVKNENTLSLGEGTVKDETTVKTEPSVEDSAVKSEPITEAKEENAAEITQAKEESVTETADIAMQDLNGNSLPVKQEEQIESKSVIDQPPQPEEGLPKVTPHVSVTDASETVDVNGLSWPSSKILSHRVKRILRSLDMVKRQQEKDTKKEQKVRERERKEEEKMKKKQELAAEWTKREKQDFYRALVTFGCPMDQSGEYHWGVIKEKANLKRKTADLIERYYVDFLTQCRNMISSNTAKQGEKRKAGRPRNDEDDGGMRGDDITFGQCKRVVQRIMMFSNLRTKVLPNEKLDKYLKRANKFVQLPKWWIPGTHDKALLVGIDRHGFGSWEEIVTDTALPFSQLIPNGANKKRKEDAPNTSPIPIAPTSDASTSARSNLTESNQSLDTDTAPISFEDKEERDLEDRDESRELDKDREDNKEDRDEPRDERDDERDDDEEDEDDDDDMGDSDKERDGGKGVEGGKGKRKRRNASYADIIGFPKDKVVLKRVEQLINLVLNPRSEVSQHYNDNSSAKKKQTSLDNFAKGEKTGDGSGSEKPSGRGRGRGRGGGPGSRGGGRGRGRGRGRGAANLPTSHASMEEAKQKANTISDYMLAGREEKRRKLADMDDQVMHERVIYDKPLSPPPPPPSMKAKYTPPPPPHHSTRNTYLEDDSEQYSFTRTNIFNNEDLEDDVSPPPPHLHHSHLPPRHYDSHPHHKLQNLPLPHHEPSFSPSFPPLQNYSQFHYNDNNNDSNFHFERQNKNKLPVQLPPLFPPPPMYDRSLPHERGGIPPHDIGLPPHDRNLSLNQVLNNSR